MHMKASKRSAGASESDDEVVERHTASYGGLFCAVTGPTHQEVQVWSDSSFVASHY